MYEDDVEDATRECDDPIMAECFVLLGYMMHLYLTVVTEEKRAGFYRRRRDLPVAGKLAQASASIAIVKDMYGAHMLAAKSPMGPILYMTISYWIRYKDIVLAKLRLPVSEKASKFLDGAKTGAAQTAVEALLGLLKQQKGEK